NGSPGRKVQETRSRSAFDQADIARPRAFSGVLRRELDALSFAQQLEHRASHRAAVEEVLDAALVADEPESFVDEEPCDCAGWHTRSPPLLTHPGESPGHSAGNGRLYGNTSRRGRGAS